MMKNKFWSVVIAILIITPTIVAIANYFTSKGSPVTQHSVSEITMVDLYGEEYLFEKSGDEFDLSDISTNMVRFFTDVTTNAKAEPELPEPLKGTEYYKVTMKNYGKEVAYKYYFNEQANYCYYTDEADKCFLIDANYAAAFLTSIYGRSVFDNATLPIMTTPSGEIIEPTDIKWSYLTINDLYPTYTATNEEAAGDTVYNISDGFQLSFTVPASSISVSVTENGNEIYNGLYENIVFAEIPGNTELSVKVTAKWYETEERASEGEATYNFKCQITDKAEFYLTTNGEKVFVGDFVNLNCVNVIAAPSAVKFTSSPKLDVEPVFYKNGNYIQALIPIPLGTEAGDYTFTVEADGITDTFELTVEGKNLSTKHEEIDSNVLSDEAFAEFNEAVEDILKEESTEVYFDGEFIYPVLGSSVTSGFGRPTETSSGYKYTNEWVRVTASAGDDVLAMNAGKVVYVGKHTMTGRTLIIDHGLGLKTVYANLTGVEVSVGDVVATGDKVGVSGKAGYSDGGTVSVAMVINGVYVCPYEIWDETGIKFDTKPVIDLSEDDLTDTSEEGSSIEQDLSDIGNIGGLENSILSGSIGSGEEQN